MRKCVVESCRRSRRYHPHIRLFKFPSAECSLGQIWRQKCQIDPNLWKNNMKICDRHFVTSDIGLKQLRRGAEPMFFLTSSSNDANINEMPLISPPRNEATEEIEVSCFNCLNHIKSANFYRKKYNKVLEENNKLREEIKLLKADKVNKNLNSIAMAIDSVKDISLESKMFCKMLLKCRQRHYNEETKWLAQNIFYVSRRSYLFLRNTLSLNLPHENSINNWMPIKNLQPGFINAGFEVFKSKCSSLRQLDRDYAIMLLDEMAISAELRYNEKLDLIDGFEDTGFFRNSGIGKQMSMFMIKGLFSNWSLILNYFVSQNGLSGDCLSNIILENLQILSNIGVTVRVITCDQGSTNRKAFSNFGVTSESPFFLFNEKKIFCMYDFPHLVKSLRNGLLKCDLCTPDGIVSFKVLRELWKREQYASTRLCPKLSRQHIEPRHFEKMKVKFATQVFSKTVQAAVRTVNATCGFRRCSADVALATADFIEKIDQIFDCMNSCSLYGDNCYRSALQLNNRAHEYIKFFVTYLNNVAFVDKKKKVFFLNGMKTSLNAVLHLLDEVLKSNEGQIFFIMTKFLNQDRLENKFSLIRQKGGYSFNPSVAKINSTIAKLMTQKLMQSSPSGNCEIVEEDRSFESVLDISPNGEINLLSDTDEDTSDFLNDAEQNCALPCSFENVIVSELELTSLRYFTGYVAKKILPKIGCEMCHIEILKEGEILTSPSELFIFFKNYNPHTSFGSLVAPSDNYFDICKKHISVFTNLFKSKPEELEIKRLIIDKCVLSTPEWFSGECREHRIQLLDFFLIVLLRKHCSWAVEKVRWTK